MKTAVIMAQLCMWKVGRPIHVGPKLGGHCVPDFSCCHPALLAPVDDRIRFMHGTEEERTALQVKFLAAYFETSLGISGETDTPDSVRVPPGLVN